MSFTSTHPNAWSLINDLVSAVLVVGDPRCRVLPRRRRSLRFRARLEKAVTAIVVNVDDALVAAANRTDGGISFPARIWRRTLLCIGGVHSSDRNQNAHASDGDRRALHRITSFGQASVARCVASIGRNKISNLLSVNSISPEIKSSCALHSHRRGVERKRGWEAVREVVTACEASCVG
jgi:hypothetical protein